MQIRNFYLVINFFLDITTEITHFPYNVHQKFFRMPKRVFEQGGIIKWSAD